MIKAEMINYIDTLKQNIILMLKNPNADTRKNLSDFWHLGMIRAYCYNTGRLNYHNENEDEFLQKVETAYAKSIWKEDHEIATLATIEKVSAILHDKNSWKTGCQYFRDCDKSESCSWRLQGAVNIECINSEQCLKRDKFDEIAKMELYIPDLYPEALSGLFLLHLLKGGASIHFMRTLADFIKVIDRMDSWKVCQSPDKCIYEKKFLEHEEYPYEGDDTKPDACACYYQKNESGCKWYDTFAKKETGLYERYVKKCTEIMKAGQEVTDFLVTRACPRLRLLLHKEAYQEILGNEFDETKSSQKAWEQIRNIPVSVPYKIDEQLITIGSLLDKLKNPKYRIYIEAPDGIILASDEYVKFYRNEERENKTVKGYKPAYAELFGYDEKESPERLDVFRMLSGLGIRFADLRQYFDTPLQFGDRNKIKCLETLLYQKLSEDELLLAADDVSRRNGKMKSCFLSIRRIMELLVIIRCDYPKDFYNQQLAQLKAEREIIASLKENDLIETDDKSLYYRMLAQMNEKYLYGMLKLFADIFNQRIEAINDTVRAVIYRELKLNEIDEHIRNQLRSSKEMTYSIGHGDWRCFYVKHKNLMRVLFGDVKEIILENEWLIALKVLLYIDPVWFGKSREWLKETKIPKKITVSWFREHNVAFDKAVLKDVIALMIILLSDCKDIVVAKEWYDKDRKSRQDTLHMLLDNIRSHDDADFLERIRGMLYFQKLAIFTTDEEKRVMRELMTAVYESWSEKNSSIIYMRLGRILNSFAEITKEKRDILLEI